MTAKGELWTVRVTPNDGFHDGTFTDMSILVQNSPPLVNSTSITLAPKLRGPPHLQHGVSDADGDSLVETWSWLNTSTGAVLGNSSTFTADTGHRLTR